MARILPWLCRHANRNFRQNRAVCVPSRTRWGRRYLVVHSGVVRDVVGAPESQFRRWAAVQSVRIQATHRVALSGVRYDDRRTGLFTRAGAHGVLHPAGGGPGVQPPRAGRIFGFAGHGLWSIFHSSRSLRTRSEGRLLDRGSVDRACRGLGGDISPSLEGADLGLAVTTNGEYLECSHDKGADYRQAGAGRD